MKKIKCANKSIQNGVITGTAISLLIGIIGAAIAAAAIQAQRIPESSIQIIACILLLVSSAAGCFIGGRVVGAKRALVSGITAGTYLLTLVSVTIIFFDGIFRNIWTGLACIVGGFVLSCIMCLKGNEGKRYKKRAIGKLHKKI